MDTWFNSYETVLHFGRVLRTAGAFWDGAEDSIDSVFAYFEKPWKWDDEFHGWCKLGRPEEPESVEALLTAVMPDDDGPVGIQSEEEVSQ